MSRSHALFQRECFCMTNQKKKSTVKKKMGRPRLGRHLAKAITIRIPGELIGKLDAWGKTNKVADRSQIIRILVERGLKA